ncbi:MAG: hypothetical protein K2K52_05285 [Paramuribaculum sp.]|nr:hypothetical protein [Paramuribaculum sp.]
MIRKSILAIIAFAIFFPIMSLADEAKKPTVMILPSDNWCTQRYFTQSFDNQGTTVKVSDYRRAFTEDIELPQVISKVGGVLTGMGYSLKDAEMEIKSLGVKQAEDNAMSSKTSGALIAETPLDVLKRRMKSDIVLQLWWNITKEPAGKVVSFTLEAFDAYTNKRIATATGNSQPTNGAIPVALENAVKANVKEFDKQLDKWYADQKKNGREIVLTVRCWDNWDNDLETEYNGEELTDVIQNWIRDNTVNGSFNLSDGIESFAQFEQVRIPLKDKNGKAMDARSFATALRKYLQKPPYDITSKVVIRGLGEAILILGEK